MAKRARVIPIRVKPGPRESISKYVRQRLTGECQSGRGKAAEIARATGLSTAHITNIQKSERGVGDDAARALGTYWGLSFAQLEEEALRWMAAQIGSRPPPSSTSGRRGTWGEHPRWSVEYELARTMRPPSIPERYLDMLANAVVPDRDPSAASILEFAKALFMTEGVDVADVGDGTKKDLSEQSTARSSEAGDAAEKSTIAKMKGRKST